MHQDPSEPTALGMRAGPAKLPSSYVKIAIDIGTCIVDLPIFHSYVNFYQTAYHVHCPTSSKISKQWGPRNPSGPCLSDGIYC